MAYSNMVCDAHLSTLCWRSRVAFRQWTAAGSPRSCPLCKKNVSVPFHCKAQLQRKVIQKRDQAFRSHHPKTSSQKSGGTSLLINRSPNSDPSSVLPYGLTISQTSALLTSLYQSLPSGNLEHHEVATLVDEERIVDVSFLPEEVDAAPPQT